MTLALRSVAAGLLLALAACAAPSDEDEDTSAVSAAATVVEVKPPPPAGIAFGRDTSEKGYGVSIGDKPHDERKVVYSVRLKNVSPNERLLARGEVTLSRCDDKDVAGQSGDAKTTPCDSAHMQKNPYGYDPRYAATFVLGKSASDTSGVDSSRWWDTTCTQDKHHCAIAMPETALAAKSGGDLYLNLVVAADANGHGAHSWDVMEIEQHHGALAVTRLAQGAHAELKEAKTDDLRAKGSMTIDRPKEDGDPTQVHQLLYQVKLDGLKPGDVVSVDAAMDAKLEGGFTCNPLITGQITLTESPKAEEPQKPSDANVAVKNGANCTNHGGGTCHYEKSGAVEVPKGAPSTMYVSYRATAERSCAAANGSDKWHVAGKGKLDAVVRR